MRYFLILLAAVLLACAPTVPPEPQGEPVADAMAEASPEVAPEPEIDLSGPGGKPEGAACEDTKECRSPMFCEEAICTMPECEFDHQCTGGRKCIMMLCKP